MPVESAAKERVPDECHLYAPDRDDRGRGGVLCGRSAGHHADRSPSDTTARSTTPTSVGSSPPPQPIGGGRFPVKYYLTAMMFIVFDIEIVFLYPWAVKFDMLGLFGFWAMLVFVATVFVAYLYDVRRGGLDWD